MTSRPNRQAAKFAVAYVTVAAAWIFLTDEGLPLLVADPNIRTHLSIIKGWGFVFVTGGFLYSLSRRWLNRYRQATESRLSHERSYREIFNATSEAIILHEPETGCILDANAACLRLLGCNDKLAVVGRRIEDFFQDQQPFNWKEALRQLQQSVHDTSPYMEWQGRKSNGDVLWVEVCLRRSTIGGKGCILAVARDITPGKLVKQAVQEHEDRLAHLLTATPVIVYALRVAADTVTTTYVSPNVRNTLGHDPEAFVRDPGFWRSHVHPDDAAHVAASLDKLKQSDRLSLEYRFRHADGSYRWTHDVLQRIRDGQEPAREYVGHWIDITDRKLAEIAHQAAERHYRALFEQAGEGIMIMTPAGELLEVNATFARMHGYSPAELKGKDIQFLDVLKVNALKNRENLLQRVRAGEVVHFEVEHWHKDGHTFPLAVAGSQFEVEGQPYFIGFHQDITERKQTETAREISREVLRLLNEPDTFQSIMKRVVAVIKARTGFDAVGLRLRDGDDYPYTSQQGFPNDFLATENSIVARTVQGGTCHNPDGTVRLECTCGLVISGKTDPANPLFTPGGSCWTNNSFPFLELPQEQDPRYQPRNQCIIHGYASVMLVPIRNQHHIMGLIQCNDRRSGQFTLKLVQHFEEIGTHIGLALERIQAETAVRESRERYALTEHAVNDGLWDWNIITDEEYFSPRWLDIAGLKEGELPAHRSAFLNLLHPEDQARAGEVMRSHLEERQPYRVEFRVRHKDGGYRWVYSRSEALRDATGRPVRMVGSVTDISGRKQAEEELQRLTQWLLKTQAISRVGGWAVNLKSGELWTSPEARRIYGVDGHEPLTFQDIKIFALASFRPRLDAALQDLLAGAKPYDLEFQIVRKTDGAIVDVHSVAEYDAAASQILGVIEDITERKRDQQKANHLAAIVEHSNDCIIGKDLAGMVTSWNQGAEKMFGYPAEEMIGVPITRIIPADRQAEENFILEQIRLGKCVDSFETVRQTKSGKLIHVSITASPIRDAAGRIAGIAKVARDITERKQAEYNLARLATAVEQSDETIVITDLEANIVYANPAFEKTTGYALAEVLGKNPRLLQSGKQDDVFYRQMWDTLTAGKPWSGHFSNRRKDGSIYHEEATVSPVRDAAGKVVNYVAVKRDITHEIKLEEALRQSQKLEAIGQLAGGVAHDFNNILAATMIQLELLQMEPHLEADSRAGLKEMDIELKRAAGLTRQLLMFSRRSVLSLQTLEFNDVVANLLKMLHRLIGEHVELIFRSCEGLTHVSADSGMLEQVLMNLVVNARDAMPEGGQVTISTARVTINEAACQEHPERRLGTFVCLSVADTGCGMDPATLKRIFEPFFTTKEVGRGTGLGLATAIGIVSQHKGWIEVESEVGRGSKFSLYLPAVEIAPNGGSSKAEAVAALLRGNETILLVEDDAKVRQALVRTIRILGYRVLEAVDGRDALRVWLAHQGQIDLLFTDMIMPRGISGLELSRRLRREQPGLKVIISSGYNPEFTQITEGMLDGCMYLAKPYPLAELSKILRQRLDQT